MLFGEGELRLFHFTMRAPKNSPQDYQERDARIRQMHEAGVSNKEIVLAVGISREALRLVFKKVEAERVANERSIKLLREFRSIADLDRKWKVGELMRKGNVPLTYRATSPSRPRADNDRAETYGSKATRYHRCERPKAIESEAVIVVLVATLALPRLLQFV
jgi:hypothetical protein